MKKNIVFLFLPVFLFSCNIPASSPSSLPESTTAFPTSTSGSVIPILPTSTLDIATPAAPPPSLTPAPLLQAPAANVIQFDPGGTYKDVQGNVATGQSKTYQLGAAQGQIMSVSVSASDDVWGYFPLQIRGRNGVVLCPADQNTECDFWRGTLPTTQDYYITVTAGGDQTNFTLRVAINPPGKDAQYFKYSNALTGYSLTYPDTFVPAIPIVGNYKIHPELTLHFIDSKMYDKTNLGEVYLFVGSSSDPQVVATCTSPNQNGAGVEQMVGNEVINGYTFVHSTSDDAGAGNIYQQEIYRMVNKNICYEVVYYLHSANIGNFSPDSNIIEFNHDAIIQKLSSVFSTFAIK